MSLFDRTTRIVIVAGVTVSLALVLCRRARRYFKGAQFTDPISAGGKIAVVTGANSGIGFETVKELNLRGAKVYMLCRFESRARTALAKLIKAGCDPTRLIYVHCDLSSKESVKKCVAELAQHESHIDILINNAATSPVRYLRTDDGHEMTWQTNYLGPFLLTELLLPHLEKANRGRIINVASSVHEIWEFFNSNIIIDPNTIDDEIGFEAVHAYGKSKLAIILYTRELSRRLRRKGISSVTVNALYPGLVRSGIDRYERLETRMLINALRFFWKTPRDGTQTSLYLALSPEVKDVSGEYFKECARGNIGSMARNRVLRRALYLYSRIVVGLNFAGDVNEDDIH